MRAPAARHAVATQPYSEGPAGDGGSFPLRAARTWRQQRAFAFLLEANTLVVDLRWPGPLKEDGRTDQIELVETAVAQGVDGIVLAPLDEQALVGPVERAIDKGIPVVIIDSALDSTRPVSFVATQGGGRFYAGTGVTDGNGYASDYWILGPTAGAQAAEARAVTGPTGVQQVFGAFTATAVPGVPTKLAFVQQPSSLRAGEAMSPAVTTALQDAFGNIVTAASGSVSLHILTSRSRLTSP